MADQQAGWYPDPSGDVSKLRYWDGMQWTSDYADALQAPQPVQPGEQVRLAEFVQPAQPEQPTHPQPAPPVQPTQLQPAVQHTTYANPAGGQPYMQAAHQQTNGLAIASLICGIFGICFGVFSFFFGVFSIAAIITGVIAKKHPGNSGMATAGLVLGIVGVALLALSIIALAFLIWLPNNTLAY